MLQFVVMDCLFYTIRLLGGKGGFWGRFFWDLDTEFFGVFDCRDMSEMYLMQG
jgi:hypothetical protein